MAFRNYTVAASLNTIYTARTLICYAVSFIELCCKDIQNVLMSERYTKRITVLCEPTIFSRGNPCVDVNMNHLTVFVGITTASSAFRRILLCQDRKTLLTFKDC